MTKVCACIGPSVSPPRTAHLQRGKWWRKAVKSHPISSDYEPLQTIPRSILFLSLGLKLSVSSSLNENEEDKRLYYIALVGLGKLISTGALRRQDDSDSATYDFNTQPLFEYLNTLFPGEAASCMLWQLVLIWKKVVMKFSCCCEGLIIMWIRASKLHILYVKYWKSQSYFI